MENIKIEEADRSVSVKIDTKIYPLPIIMQSASIFIDKAWIALDGDPEKEVTVIIKPKDENAKLSEIGAEFSNELLNYSAYFVRSQMSRDIREAFIRRALETVSPSDNRRIEEMQAKKQKIDLGAKVPIMDVPQASENEKKSDNFCISKGGSPDTEKEEFSFEEISKPWEEQKGAIKKEPKEL